MADYLFQLIGKKCVFLKKVNSARTSEDFDYRTLNDEGVYFDGETVVIVAEDLECAKIALKRHGFEIDQDF